MAVKTERVIPWMFTCYSWLNIILAFRNKFTAKLAHWCTASVLKVVWGRLVHKIINLWYSFCLNNCMSLTVSGCMCADSNSEWPSSRQPIRSSVHGGVSEQYDWQSSSAVHQPAVWRPQTARLRIHQKQWGDDAILSFIHIFLFVMLCLLARISICIHLSTSSISVCLRVHKSEITEIFFAKWICKKQYKRFSTIQWPAARSDTGSLIMIILLQERKRWNQNNCTLQVRYFIDKQCQCVSKTLI